MTSQALALALAHELRDIAQALEHIRDGNLGDIILNRDDPDILRAAATALELISAPQRVAATAETVTHLRDGLLRPTPSPDVIP